LVRLLYEDLGIHVISPESWGVHRVEELLYSADFYSVFSAGNGEVEVYELKVPENWSGKKLSDLMTEGGCMPIAVTRGGRAMLPDPQMVLAAEDVIHFSATFEGINHLRNRVDIGKDS
jgi:trk system potassium uptake protein TrkA